MVRRKSVDDDEADDPTPWRRHASYYRKAATRARALEAEATTPTIKRHLRQLIDQYEQLAGEVERDGRLG
jgi:hypothetical protein